MQALTRIPFRTGFYLSIVVAAAIFFLATQFVTVDRAFYQKDYAYKGLLLLTGLTEKYGVVVLEPQSTTFFVLLFALIACILAIFKGVWRFKAIGSLGVLSVILLVVQIGNVGKLAPTPAYYLVILIVAASTAHAWAHAMAPAAKPVDDQQGST
jgi:hypothetical protein